MGTFCSQPLVDEGWSYNFCHLGVGFAFQQRILLPGCSLIYTDVVIYNRPLDLLAAMMKRIRFCHSVGSAV